MRHYPHPHSTDKKLSFCLITLPEIGTIYKKCMCRITDDACLWVIKIHDSLAMSQFDVDNALENESVSRSHNHYNFSLRGNTGPVYITL